MREFQGRVVIPGTVTAEVLVSHDGFNVVESFNKPLQVWDETAKCSDRNNEDIYGKEMAGKALCLPQTTGSATGGMVLYCACAMERNPACMLFSKPIDSLAAAGAVLADVWVDGVTMPVIDSLGDEFLDCVKNGMTVTVRENGVVEVDEEIKPTSEEKRKKSKRKSVIIYAVSLVLAIAVAFSLYIRMDRPSQDIVDYINNDRKKINSLYSSVYDSMKKMGSVCKTNKDYIEYYEGELIPIYNEILKECEKVEYETKEVESLHNIYVKYIEKRKEKYVLIVEALKKNDKEMLAKAPKIEEESSELFEEFINLRDKYAKKYSLTTKERK